MPFRSFHVEWPAECRGPKVKVETRVPGSRAGGRRFSRLVLRKAAKNLPRDPLRPALSWTSSVPRQPPACHRALTRNPKPNTLPGPFLISAWLLPFQATPTHWPHPSSWPLYHSRPATPQPALPPRPKPLTPARRPPQPHFPVFPVIGESRGTTQDSHRADRPEGSDPSGSCDPWDDQTPISPACRHDHVGFSALSR